MATTSNSNTTQLTLYKDSLAPGFHTNTLSEFFQRPGTHCAVWVFSDGLVHNGESVAKEKGCFLISSDSLSNESDSTIGILRFMVSNGHQSKANDTTRPDSNTQMIISKTVDIPLGQTVFRLDQVDFPPSAIAYRHTHPGPGIRYLCRGGLTLNGDHETQKLHTGEAWFEPANSPVEAVATASGPSAFVRAMLLPPEFEARPTFTLQNKDDALKPTLQRNTRHCEKRIQLSSISH